MWYGHKPFSENAQLMQVIDKYSNVDIRGRYIFRIDEWIQPAGCIDLLDFDQENFVFLSVLFKKETTLFSYI